MSSNASLEVGSSIQLTPAWSSANDSIATVSESGLVTAVSPGTVEVYCSIGEGPATRIIQVVKAPEPIPEPADV